MALVNKNFTQVPNHIIEDERLNGNPLRLLLTIIQFREDPEKGWSWTFRNKHLLDQLNWGDPKQLDRARKVLLKLGYLHPRENAPRDEVHWELNLDSLVARPEVEDKTSPESEDKTSLKGGGQNDTLINTMNLTNNTDNNTESKSNLDDTPVMPSEGLLDQMTDSVTDDNADGANEVNQPVGGDPEERFIKATDDLTAKAVRQFENGRDASTDSIVYYLKRNAKSVGLHPESFDATVVANRVRNELSN